MDQNQTTGGAPAEQSTPQTSGSDTSGGAHSVVPMVIAFFALLVAAIAVYFFMAADRAGYTPNAPLPAAETVLPDPASIPAGAEDPAVNALSAQGTSDEVADIARDLNATDMSTLDSIDEI